MINLLSLNDRKQLSAARTNTLLLRYNMLLGIVIGVLIIEMVGIYLILNVDKARNQQVIQDNASKTQAFDITKIKAAQFTSDLSTAKFILDNQTPYTKLIVSIASTLPQDAVIDSLALNPANFGTPTQMTIHTKSYQSAISVKQYLQSSKIFSDVSFQSIAQSTDNAGAYPYTAVYNVTISKEAATL